MIPIIILIVVFIGFVLAIFWLVKQHLFFKDILDHFKKMNVVVAGKKGTGKDLLFQKIINKRKEYYYTNLPNGYGGNNEHISLREIACEPNTYDDFINEKIVKSKRRFMEKCDIYISDAGVYLPSNLDSMLYKKYPSMPIYYALSRQLADHNIHANVQVYSKLWKALREQADYYVTCKKTIKWIPFFLFTKCISYEKLDSAMQELLPIKSRIMNKYSKAEADQYNATNGLIRVGWVIQRKSKIKYDSRAFEKLIYDDDRIEFVSQDK